MTHDTTHSEFDNDDYTEKCCLKKARHKHNEHGEEIGNPTPMQPPLGHKKSLSLAEQIAQQVRIHHIQQLENELMEETEDDADDFEIGDDFEPLSKHENDHMPTLKNLKAQAARIQSAIRKKNLEKAVEVHQERADKVAAKNNPAPEVPEPASKEQ